MYFITKHPRLSIQKTGFVTKLLKTFSISRKFCAFLARTKVFFLSVYPKTQRKNAPKRQTYLYYKRAKPKKADGQVVAVRIP